jgi:hypothetical protein
MTDAHEPAPQPAGGDATPDLAIPGEPRPRLVWAPANPDGGLSPQLARFILDAYTATGDVVIDVDDDAAFAATAAQTGRRHHALGGTKHLATLGHAAGYIDLMLLRWPCDAAHPHWLFFACLALLRTASRTSARSAVPRALPAYRSSTTSPSSRPTTIRPHDRTSSPGHPAATSARRDTRSLAWPPRRR